MDCTACGGKIRRGERYVAFERHTERESRFKVVKVEDAEMTAAYHMDCAPERS